MINLGQIKDSDTLAPKDSPSLTGSPKATTPLQSESDTTRIATVGFVRTAVAAGGGGSSAAAVFVLTDDTEGNITIGLANTSSSLAVTDDGNGNIVLSLT